MKVQINSGFLISKCHVFFSDLKTLPDLRKTISEVEEMEKRFSVPPSCFCSDCVVHSANSIF